MQKGLKGAPVRSWDHVERSHMPSGERSQDYKFGGPPYSGKL